MSKEIKQDVRKAVKADLRKLSQEQMSEESGEIQKLLISSEIFKNARTVGIYVHCAKLREVDTSRLLESVLTDPSKKCFVPLVKEEAALMHMLHIENMNDLRPMTMNIMEPTENYPLGAPRQEALELNEPLDLLIMPGLAFDTSCNRLGRGGGYYDCFLEKCAQKADACGAKPPILVALAYSAQMIDSVPMADNDMQVDMIVTANGVITRQK
eukprot:CAMPEP_0198213616 /NCGR_PEP_ID=MMETSP1445-20131203/28968_1 /TAXON_ID=36898 /ORGANISM="Pyramimonas sp., Strain CCMP2087" /LENGTH=211 /DNA_ID=CAMNT_0043888283 /DNA_START=258 /DNA_END=893 /DNA_ORIENTATION=+